MKVPGGVCGQSVWWPARGGDEASKNGGLRSWCRCHTSTPSLCTYVFDYMITVHGRSTVPSTWTHEHTYILPAAADCMSPSVVYIVHPWFPHIPKHLVVWSSFNKVSTFSDFFTLLAVITVILFSLMAASVVMLYLQTNLACLHHLIPPPRDAKTHHFLAKTQFTHEKVVHLWFTLAYTITNQHSDS